MARKALLAVALAALLTIGWVKHENRIHLQQRLAKIASQIAGRPVGVRCPSLLGDLTEVGGEAGTVRFDHAGRPANYTNLAPETCNQLRRFSHVDFSCLDRNACGFSQFEAGWAAHTLAHESFHLRGYRDEGVAECYAMQNTAFVAEQLGMSKPRAQELQQWLYDKAFHNEPTEYQSPQCYPGGPLDLTPQTPSFP